MIQSVDFPFNSDVLCAFASFHMLQIIGDSFFGLPRSLRTNVVRWPDLGVHLRHRKLVAHRPRAGQAGHTQSWCENNNASETNF